MVCGGNFPPFPTHPSPISPHFLHNVLFVLCLHFYNFSIYPPSSPFSLVFPRFALFCPVSLGCGGEPVSAVVVRFHVCTEPPFFPPPSAPFPQVRFVARDVRLRDVQRYVQMLRQQGRVFTELPRLTKDMLDRGLKHPNFTRQMDVSVYTWHALEHRLALKSHVEIQTRIVRWWDILPKRREHHYTITKGIAVCVAVFFVSGGVWRCVLVSAVAVCAGVGGCVWLCVLVSVAVCGGVCWCLLWRCVLVSVAVCGCVCWCLWLFVAVCAGVCCGGVCWCRWLCVAVCAGVCGCLWQCVLVSAVAVCAGVGGCVWLCVVVSAVAVCGCVCWCLLWRCVAVCGGVCCGGVWRCVLVCAGVCCGGVCWCLLWRCVAVCAGVCCGGVWRCVLVSVAVCGCVCWCLWLFVAVCAGVCCGGVWRCVLVSLWRCVAVCAGVCCGGVWRCVLVSVAVCGPAGRCVAVCGGVCWCLCGGVWLCVLVSAVAVCGGVCWCLWLFVAQRGAVWRCVAVCCRGCPRVAVRGCCNSGHTRAGIWSHLSPWADVRVCARQIHGGAGMAGKVCLAVAGEFHHS